MTVATLFSFAAYEYFLKQRDTYVQERRRELTSIAHLKIQQIDRWRQERLSDARYVFNNKVLAGAIVTFATSSPTEANREHILAWMRAMYKNSNYAALCLCTVDGEQILSLPGDVFLSHEWKARKAEQAFKERQVVMSDFERDIRDTIMLSMTVPFFTREGRPAAVVYYKMDPDAYLYPLLRDWPVPSATSECLMARVVGDSVEAISEPRHLPGGLMRARRPLSQNDLPASMAVHGMRGIVTARDYRGVPVLAYIDQVPGSPWYFTAKTDIDEIYSMVHYFGWVTVIIFSLALLAFGAIILLIFRHQRTTFLKRELEAANERAALIEHYEHLAQNANDIILLLDDSLRIVEINKRGEEIYGFTRTELIGMRIADLRTDEEQSLLESEMETLRRQGRHIFETAHRRKDGSGIPVEVSARAIEIQGKVWYQSIVRDITERKEAETRIRHLNRMYAMLSNINQLIVRERDAASLFEGTCTIAVRDGGFRLAWVGVAEAGRTDLRIAAATGPASGYISSLRVAIDDSPHGMGPTGRAFKSGTPVVCLDIDNDPSMLPWRDNARAHELRSSAVFPLMAGGRVIGVLNLYSDEPFFFTSSEVELLNELALDVSYALDVFDLESRRIESERALMESERKYRDLVETSQDLIWQTDVHGKLSFVNTAVRDIFGIPAEGMLGRSFVEFMPQDERDRVLALYAQTVQTVTQRIEDEAVIIRADGTRAHVSTKLIILRDEHGTPTGMRGTTRDITERERAAREQRALEEKLHSFFQANILGVILTDIHGQIHDANDEFLRIIGRSRIELEMHQIRWDAITPPEFRELDEQSIHIAQQRGRCKPYEKQYLRPDGSRVWVLIGFVLLGDAREEAVAFILDLTTLKTKEEEVRILNVELENRVQRRTAQLEAANRELEAFSYSVSHDLRAPLRAIDGFARMLDDDCSSLLPPDGLRYISVIRKSTKRMGQLIDDLLAFSRIGRGEMRRISIDMTMLATETASELTASLDRARIDLQIGTLPDAWGDPTLLHVVWMNLIDNALKFTSKCERATITISGRQSDDSATYTVQDNGAGFDMRYADKLFGVFQRLHTVDEFEGTGVGLASVQRVVHRHGGFVHAEGVPGQGASFSFTLPLKKRI